MKVVSAQQMSHLESLAYRDGASEEDFMEEAGSGVALVVHEYIEIHALDRLILLICGKGNNAGDAYVAGAHLLHLDYQVFAFPLAPIEECSPLCQRNYHRFLNEGGRIGTTLLEHFVFPPNGVIVDGIFGTGFHGTAQEPYASAIDVMNQSGLPIISVDIPSGLNASTGEAKSHVVVATETAFLGLPKMGFFLLDGWDHVGKLRYVDFGLDAMYAESAETNLFMLSAEIVKPFLPRLRRSRHKYEAGYVVALAGSPGLPGAAIMSANAALHGGAGIVRLLYPEGMQEELIGCPDELIKTAYRLSNIEEVVATMNAASATLVGPGLGRAPEQLALLKKVLPRLTKPCVIDADALTLMAEEEIALPAETILTPHHGEMNRLLHLREKVPLTMDYLRSCQDFINKKNTTLVLKGGPTFILHPNASIKVNPRGDPGMATAGSGDILTGLLAALLAQGLSPQRAAQLGVYIHAVAGEHAAQDMTSYCMTANGILDYFPEGFSLREL